MYECERDKTVRKTKDEPKVWWEIESDKQSLYLLLKKGSIMSSQFSKKELLKIVSDWNPWPKSWKHSPNVWGMNIVSLLNSLFPHRALLSITHNKVCLSVARSTHLCSVCIWLHKDWLTFKAGIVWKQVTVKMRTLLDTIAIQLDLIFVNFTCL